MSQPIYNDPSHPAYGPCRRLHIMLLQLFADADFGRIEDDYRRAFTKDWTATVSHEIGIGCPEAAVQRGIVRRFDNILDEQRRNDFVRDRAYFKA